MTLEQFFSKNWLLDANPPRESRLYLFLLIFFALLILLSLLTRLSSKRARFVRRFFWNLALPGILGLIYLFCRYESLPWLGSRLFLLVIFFILFFWLLYNLIWFMRFIPRWKKEQRVRERFYKYLPKADR